MKSAAQDKIGADAQVTLDLYIPRRAKPMLRAKLFRHLLRLLVVLVQAQRVVADHERHQRDLVPRLLHGAPLLAHRHPHTALGMLGDLRDKRWVATGSGTAGVFNQAC